LNYPILVLSLGLSLSISGNAVLFFLLKKTKKAPAPTQEAKALLSHMLKGQALLRITVMDPENLMMRSPRR